MTEQQDKDASEQTTRHSESRFLGDDKYKPALDSIYAGLGVSLSLLSKPHSLEMTTVLTNKQTYNDLMRLGEDECQNQKDQ